MTSPVRLDIVGLLQYLYDQMVPRLESIQDAFDQHEYARPGLKQLEEEVSALKTAAEQIEEAALFCGDAALARLCDTLGYAGRESSMGAPMKGLAELATFPHELATFREHRQEKSAINEQDAGIKG
jgi:hypothetical protein